MIEKESYQYLNPSTRLSMARFPVSSHVLNKLGFSNVGSAIVVPGFGCGGGIWSTNGYLKSAMPTPWWWSEKHWKGPQNVMVDESDAVFLGAFEPCWGHCFTDNLKFLWPFIICPENLVGRKLVYVITRPDKQLPQNFLDLLNFLGIDCKGLICLRKPTHFRSVLLPDSAFFCNDQASGVRYFTSEYVQMIERIIRGVVGERKIVPSRQVYFTRSAWKGGNKDFGEKYVEKLFRNKGYEIISPEKLTFRQMVLILQECRSFAATEGSNAHNAVFLPCGAQVIIIKKCNWTTEYQMPITEIRGLDVTYIDAHKTILPRFSTAPYCGPFFIYVNKNLAQWAGVKSYFPIVDFLLYVLYCLKLRVRDLCVYAFIIIKRILSK